MSDELRIEKSIARGIGYCLECVYLYVVFFAIILSIIFIILKAWTTLLITDILLLIGFFVIAFPIYWIAKAKDKTVFIFTCGTIKGIKGETELFTAQLDNIESISFFPIIPFLDLAILPSPTLVIKLRSENQKEIRIFCKKTQIDVLKKVLKKEIISRK